MTKPPFCDSPSQVKRILALVALLCNPLLGHIYELRRNRTKRAWMDLFRVIGDDVILKDESWMKEAYLLNSSTWPKKQTFLPVLVSPPLMFEVPSPDVLTFPIPHLTHTDIFNGKSYHTWHFIDQDYDPFILWSTILSHHTCSNSIPDIHLRINEDNLWDSASRNRGMRESAANRVHFLDDDVV